MIKGVFFDFNGCLLDDRALTFKSALDVCRSFGTSRLPTFEEWRRNTGNDYMNFYRSVGVNSSVSSEVLNAVRNAYIFSNWHLAQLRSDAKSVVQRCKASGFKVAIVSAETDKLLSRRIKEADMESLFDKIYTDEIGRAHV